VPGSWARARGDRHRIALVEVPPITLSAVTRDRLDRCDNDRYACECVTGEPGKLLWVIG